MSLHFFPNRENANARIVYLIRSLQNIVALRLQQSFILSTNPTQKRDNRKLTTNRADKS